MVDDASKLENLLGLKQMGCAMVYIGRALLGKSDAPCGVVQDILTPAPITTTQSNKYVDLTYSCIF